MFAVDCTLDEAGWHRRSIKVTTPLEEKKTREAKAQNPRTPSFSAHSKISTHFLKVDQRHRRQCSNTHRKEVGRTDGAEENKRASDQMRTRAPARTHPMRFHVQVRPCPVPPVISQSRLTHWAERKEWESGAAGRRHDGHMRTCVGPLQERKSSC